MLKKIKEMFMGRGYICIKCKTTFNVAQSDKFVKTVMPTCPVCNSKNVRVK